MGIVWLSLGLLVFLTRVRGMLNYVGSPGMLVQLAVRGGQEILPWGSVGSCELNRSR